MTQNPILKVLSIFRKHRVKSLLIGGQACIIYGAAEFSRDSDFLILVSQKNLKNLKKTLKTLRAEQIYLPPLEASFLERGHACHFRCKRGDVKNLRIDIISTLRGCDEFKKLWLRKEIVSLKDNSKIDIIGLGDLVQSKKTQRDKDWLMLKRLVENDIILHKDNPKDKQIIWWLQECRSAQTLIELAERYPRIAKKCIKNRPLLSYAIVKDIKNINAKLYQEELLERRKDIEYWIPLRKELELLRHKNITEKY